MAKPFDLEELKRKFPHGAALLEFLESEKDSTTSVQKKALYQDLSSTFILAMGVAAQEMKRRRLEEHLL